MKTFKQLKNELTNAQNLVAELNAKLRQLPGYIFIEAVNNQLAYNLLDSPADLLVSEINDRDEPMNRAEIQAVFEASGFEFDQRHIDACNADSDEVIREQAAYYTR